MNARNEKTMTEWPWHDHQIEVVGSTILPDEHMLPQRLASILRVSGIDDSYLLVDEESSVDGSTWARVDRQGIEEEMDAGSMMRIDPPIPWQQGHVLLQVEWASPPELVPAENLDARLTAIYQAALVRAAHHWDQGAREMATEQAWRALRAARTGEPLPLLLVIALERGHLSDQGIAKLEREARQYGSNDVQAALASCRRDAALAPLAALLVKGPLYEQLPEKVLPPANSTSDRPPAYLRKYPQRQGFIFESRREWCRAA